MRQLGQLAKTVGVVVVRKVPVRVPVRVWEQALVAVPVPALVLVLLLLLQYRHGHGSHGRRQPSPPT
jgi:hypothetical protein